MFVRHLSWFETQHSELIDIKTISKDCIVLLNEYSVDM